MTQPKSYPGVAYNEAPDSENEIHGDEIATKYGFEGGLVPGVTVSAYLAHPAVDAWGQAYVAGGAAHIVVEKPVFDGHAFEVAVSVDDVEQAYDAVLTDASGAIRARGRCWLPAELPQAPTRRGDAILTAGYQRPIGTPDVMRRLQRDGMAALRICWDDSAELTTYFSDANSMPAPVSPAGAHCASLGFVLGLTNWALAGNVYLTPWLHLQTDSQCFAAIEYGTELIVESAIVDLFEKKGHHFCDIDVAAFVAADDSPVMRTRLRAIYKLRG
tara:strand:+ start:3579 stop:4394 length:816 start_codon:yes stop_codon:yes gene_type:complete